nr:MAG TPA: hypothetical protein [Caudoviricetes sp.]
MEVVSQPELKTVCIPLVAFDIMLLAYLFFE